MQPQRGAPWSPSQRGRTLDPSGPKLARMRPSAAPDQPAGGQAAQHPQPEEPEKFVHDACQRRMKRASSAGTASGDGTNVTRETSPGLAPHPVSAPERDAGGRQVQKPSRGTRIDYNFSRAASPDGPPGGAADRVD
jgi:hypothetical protein